MAPVGLLAADVLSHHTRMLVYILLFMSSMQSDGSVVILMDPARRLPSCCLKCF